jgi:hypothetical protein
MSTTPNMGLTMWDLNSDPYDHDQLAANFNTIDLHEHDTYGVQLNTGALLDSAITTAKIANLAVTTGKLAASAVTAAKLDQEYVHPLGECMMWWRPDGSIAVPTGWVVPIGQTILDVDHDFPIVGSIVVPDFRNAFILGAATSGTGTGTGTPPAIGGVGGAHTASLSHTHAVNPHTHGVAGHTHTINAHSHTVAGHTHSIAASGDHTHGINGDGAHNHDLMTRSNAFESGLTILSASLSGSPGNKSNTSQSTYISGLTDGGLGGGGISVPGVAAHNHGGATVAGGDHSHGGATGSATSSTSSDGLTTNSTSMTTNADAGTTTAAGLAGSTDIRPNFVGLLIIMKVKNV